MTGGIVGGLARVYLPFSWGIPFVVFGYDLAANIQANVGILTLLWLSAVAPQVEVPNSQQ
jgi:hypothetical protein